MEEEEERMSQFTKDRNKDTVRGIEGRRGGGEEQVKRIFLLYLKLER